MLDKKFKSGISKVNCPYNNDWPFFMFYLTYWPCSTGSSVYINLNFLSPSAFVSPQRRDLRRKRKKKYGPPRLNVINGHRVFGLSFLARYVHINKTHHFWLNRTFEHEMSPLGVHSTYGLYLFFTRLVW